MLTSTTGSLSVKRQMAGGPLGPTLCTQAFKIVAVPCLSCKLTTEVLGSCCSWLSVRDMNMREPDGRVCGKGAGTPRA